jgi:protein subunit release factor B
MFPVSAAKAEDLRARLRALDVDPRLIEERFIKGGGPGGQKINKSASCVQLLYPPLGLVVRCQASRSLALNRFLALRELVDRIEMTVSPGTSRRLREIERRRAAKARRSRRARARARGDGGDGLRDGG